jgi:hypothetical protein
MQTRQSDNIQETPRVGPPPIPINTKTEITTINVIDPLNKQQKTLFKSKQKGGPNTLIEFKNQ